MTPELMQWAVAHFKENNGTLESMRTLMAKQGYTEDDVQAVYEELKREGVVITHDDPATIPATTPEMAIKSETPGAAIEHPSEPVTVVPTTTTLSTEGTAQSVAPATTTIPEIVTMASPEASSSKGLVIFGSILALLIIGGGLVYGYARYDSQSAVASFLDTTFASFGMPHMFVPAPIVATTTPQTTTKSFDTTPMASSTLSTSTDMYATSTATTTATTTLIMASTTATKTATSTKK